MNNLIPTPSFTSIPKPNPTRISAPTSNTISSSPHTSLPNFVTRCYIESYFNSLDEVNIRKRNENVMCTNEELMSKFLNSLETFEGASTTMNQKNKLEEDIARASEILKRFPRLGNLSSDSILLFSQGEFKFPHTHGDTIFLPKHLFQSYPKDFYSTLIHEKIHIFQRLYPIETYKYIRDVLECEICVNPNDLIQDSKILSFESSSKSQRINPDTNRLTYLQMSKINENDIILPIWSSLESTSSRILDDRDHPFEMMAYQLTDVILERGINEREETNERIGKNKNKSHIQSRRRELDLWISLYL